MATNPDTMDIDHPPTTTTSTNTPNPKPTPLSKTQTLTTTTLRTPPFAYAHLTLANPSPSPPTTPSLDLLQTRSYLTTALRQFLGDTGSAIPIDILLLSGSSVWVRVPRGDLPAFAAGVTAFGGVMQGGEGRMVLQVRACGDWLGALVGREEEKAVWGV